jgi:hypothetical protein
MYCLRFDLDDGRRIPTILRGLLKKSKLRFLTVAEPVRLAQAARTEMGAPLAKIALPRGRLRRPRTCFLRAARPLRGDEKGSRLILA